MRRGTVFIDDPATLKKSGDLVLALASGALAADAIAGDLTALCSGAHQGRSDKSEITVFKSAGVAREVYAAAKLVYEQLLDR